MFSAATGARGMFFGGHFLLRNQGVIATGVAYPTGINRWLQIQIAQPCRGLKLNQVILNRVTEKTVSGIKRLRCAGGKRENEFYPQFCRGAMSKTMHHDLIDPQFH